MNGWVFIKLSDLEWNFQQWFFFTHPLLYHSYMIKKIIHSKTYMIKSSQLAIIQAFTALWKIKFEQMVVISNCRQKMKNEDNIYLVCIKCIFNCWEANDHSISFISKVWNHHLLKYYLSESCKSLNNSQVSSFYHIRLWIGDFSSYKVVWKQNSFSQLFFWLTL